MANKIQQHLVPLWVLTAHITTELVATCNIYGGKNLELVIGSFKTYFDFCMHVVSRVSQIRGCRYNN